MTAALRSDHTALAAVADLLGSSSDGDVQRSYAVLPRPDRPRYVVPVDGRHARGAHIRPGTGAAQTAARVALRGALRLGAGRALPGRLVVADGDAGAPGLRRHLAALLDRDDVDLAIALGAPRPNRKPVIQVIGADGATVAWVKLGVDDHTDALVAHETDALRAVAPADGPLRTPPVRAAATWRGHPLLALGHVEMDESAASLRLTAAVVRAIAGPSTETEVPASRWWTGLTAAPDPDGRVAAVLAALAPRVADRRWRFGRWHGDLAPWNATWANGVLIAWDWERSTTPVPLGLDLFHNRVQVATLRHGTPIVEALALAARAEAPTLRELGYGPDDPPLLAAAYAATLRARFAADALHGPLGPGAPLAAGIDADPSLGLV